MMSISSLSSSCIFPPSKKGKKNAWMWHSSNKETSNTEEMLFPLWHTVVNQQRANWRGRCFLGNKIVQWGHSQRFKQEDDWNYRHVFLVLFCFLSFTHWRDPERVVFLQIFLVQLSMKVKGILVHSCFPQSYGMQKCVCRGSNFYEATLWSVRQIFEKMER